MWDDGPVFSDEGGLECSGSGTTPLNSYLGTLQYISSPDLMGFSLSHLNIIC